MRKDLDWTNGIFFCEVIIAVINGIVFMDEVSFYIS